MISVLRRPAVRTLLSTRRLRRRLNRLLSWLDLGACEVALLLTDDIEIAELNGAYRDKDGPTDVLSFAQFDPDDTVADGAIMHLGDIVVSLETAQRQADRGCLERLRAPLEAYAPSRGAFEAWSLESEVLFLALHGLLHLRGYDHIDETDARRMEAREAELMPYILSRFPSKSGRLARG
ncbi:MAG: rRNA maturation RNase YbeY [Myxococcota bacterium]|nr:rRNA maturation RNase YbeY [Myxococcota bacterium]